TKNYKIINGTVEQVTLLFYDTQGDKTELVLSESLNGEGLIVERTLETYMRDQNNPTIAFKADSVSVIFNNERVESHHESFPKNPSSFPNRSMTSSGAYEIKDFRYFTYTITQENYDNAIPCDGSCN
ncbi:MAG: hypothetical protein ABJN84_01115, partial [Flavobacteriaceae bacterium]